MDDLIGRILELHEAFTGAGLPHAFGGALALAWCTLRARGTIDIDVNVLVPAEDWARVLETLPDGVKITKQDRRILQRDSQVRLWWGKTPVDLFLNSTDFHAGLARRIRWESFGGRELPFLSCFDLAVFKAFFNRTKDWADLEAMDQAGTLDSARVQATLVHYLGADDPRVLRLAKLN
jgi:hypothetical protein